MENSAVPSPEVKSSTKPKNRWGKKHTIAAIVGGFLALLLVFSGVTVFALINLKAKATTTMLQAKEVQAAVKTQDLVKAKAEITKLGQSLDETHQAFRRLGFWRLTPLAAYYADGEHVFKAAAAGVSAATKGIDAVEPYADILGLKGKGSFTGGTAEDRVAKIIETAGLVAPAMDQVSQDLVTMETEINAINPKRYQFKVNGTQASAMIEKAQAQIGQSKDLIATIKPALEVLPDMAGLKSPKKYLVLFQNDGELRPTGGFMTAYSVIKVDKGKITPEKSDDIYELDNKFKQNLTPPDLLKKYLLTLRWNLRDMNTSPDFKTSMDQFLPYYQKLPGEGQVDGVIAIDTQVLSDLVSTLGAIDVPGYGRFSSDIDPKCNCPQIIYTMEDISTKPTPYFRSDRKAILGPMMGTILQKAYSGQNSSLPLLVQTMWRNLNQKHILMYFTDPKAQAAAEGLKLAGRLETPDPSQDYFMVVDANLGGAKSNMFVRDEVDQDITVTNGQVSKKVILTYKNPQKGSNCNLEAGQLCLNGKMPSWVRVYVPKGSVLTASTGFDANSQKSYEEAGYTVFEGVYKLDPESIAKITLDYTVPYKPANNRYLLSIQKQAGLKAPHYTVKVNGSQQEFDLVSDKTIIFPL